MKPSPWSRRPMNLPDEPLTWLPGPLIDGLPSRWVPAGAKLAVSDYSIAVEYDAKGKGHISKVEPIHEDAIDGLVDDLDIGLFLRVGAGLAFVTSDEGAYATNVDLDGKPLPLPVEGAAIPVVVGDPLMEAA